MDIASIVQTDASDKEKRRKFRQTSAVSEVVERDNASWGAVPSKMYKAVYGALPPVRKDPIGFKRTVFANGPANHAAPLITRRPNEMLPGIWSFDPQFLRFLDRLATSLNDALPVSLDSEGFTDTGVHNTFDALRCPSGWYMNPMSTVPMDNATFRDELGLDTGINPRHEKIARAVWRLVWSKVKITSINVAELSTGGARRFSKDVQWKLAFAEWLLEPSNFERYLNLIAADDWETLANEYETCFILYLQKRGQVDLPDRVRKVFDLEYALSSGARGTNEPADKRVVIDGRTYDNFSAMRARVVQAGPWAINCYLQIVATTTMHALFDVFPETFHVNTREEILNSVMGKYVWASDVKEYDRSMGVDDIRIPHEEMREFWDERIVKASWKLYTAPYYMRPLSLDGREGAWVGDPTDPTCELHAGNRSGHAFTSLIAKVNKVIDTLCIIDLMFPVLDRIEVFLRGQLPIGVINNGDDEVFWAVSKSDLQRFKTLRAIPKNGRYIVEAETGHGFSGLLLVRTGPTTYDPQSRLMTPFEKTYVNERSIGGVHRRFWPIGCIDRITNLTKTRNGQIAWEVHNKIYAEELAPVYGDFMRLVMDAYTLLPLTGDNFSVKDREVLEEPDKIHYKFKADEINPDVVAMTTKKIPPQVVEPFVMKYYHGFIM